MTVQVSYSPAAVPPLADFRFGYRASNISPDVVTGMLRLVEVLVIAVSGLAIFILYVNEGVFAVDRAALQQYILATVGGGTVASIAFQALGLYKVTSLRSIGRQVGRLLIGWSLAFALFVLCAFLFKAGMEFSRVWLVSWFLIGGAAVISLRSATAGLVQHWVRNGRLVRRAAIVGSGPATETLIRALEDQSDSDVRICGIFDDRTDQRISQSILGYPQLGTLDQLVDFSRQTRIDMVILALPLAAEDRLMQLIAKLLVLPVDIRLAAVSSKLRFSRHTYSYIGSVPMIDIAERPIADWALVQKWFFDRVVGALALIALVPVMLVTALAIRLDSKGPILFKQKRYGLNNELVEVYKFRSMYADKADQNASRLVTKGDPRVTRVGRFIRKTSIDELPQLFNVLQGQLSLVGPRPHALQAKAADSLYQDVVEGYFARHKVKPGLTGWAQINGWRGETDTREKIERRVEHDLYYIENWSVLFDLWILLRTPFALLDSKSAY
jgi:Undecaprenyl-phosphate glucose phosphotransferase